MADDDVDDYMTMTFDDDGGGGSGSSGRKKPETSLQRRARLQREGRERGRVLSKAEQARAAEQEREAALSRSLLEPVATRPSAAVNKGLAMMARMGFKPGEALGRRRAEATGEDAKPADPQTRPQTGPQTGPQTEPIRIQVKRDRAGIGATEKDDGPSKRPKTARADVDPLAYRDRIRLEREAQRLDRLVHAAQVVAEAMDEQLADATGRLPPKERPLADVDVLWRGLVRDRRRADRDRADRQRQRLRLDARLRGGDDDDDDDDDDDRLAQGQTAGTTSFLGGGGLRRTVRDAADGSGDEDEDEDTENAEDAEDAELAAWEALPADERLQRIVGWLRTHRRYCFWCKHTYADDSMDGCPGETEADHD